MNEKDYLNLFLRFLKENKLLLKYIKNYHKYSTNCKHGKSLLNYTTERCKSYDDVLSLIQGAFIFIDTEEGLEFWCKQSEKWSKYLFKILKNTN